MSIRALGRHFGASCASVSNRIDRLGRQSLALHHGLRQLASGYEKVAIDGFVGFDRSQYFPNNITIAMTSESQFSLAFTHATLRRSGSMRPAQKTRRNFLYRGVCFEPKSLERSFSDLLEVLKRDRPPRHFRPLVIVTDEKLEYGRAFRAHSLFRLQDEGHRAVHLTVSSHLPRTIHNPLFPSNYIDREIRKDQAAHRRESTCFGRNVANGLMRMACYLAWHNYEKRFRIKAPVGDARTHGQMAGIPTARIASARQDSFRERAFLSRVTLDQNETMMWLKLYPTPGARRPSYLPAYARD